MDTLVEIKDQKKQDRKIMLEQQAMMTQQSQKKGLRKKNKL